MKRLDPMMGVSYKDGTSFNLSNDLVELFKTLENISEEDASGLLRYLSNIYDRYLVAKNKILNRLYRNIWQFINPKGLVDIYNLKTFNNAYDEMSKFIKDDHIKKMFAFQTLYIGISPNSGPSLYNMIPMLELFYGVWHIEGGMYAMATEMLQNKELNQAFINLWEHEATIAEEYYEQGMNLIVHMYDYAKKPLLLSLLFYKEILEAVRLSDYNSLTKRNSVSTKRKLSLLREATSFLK